MEWGVLIYIGVCHFGGDHCALYFKFECIGKERFVHQSVYELKAEEHKNEG